MAYQTRPVVASALGVGEEGGMEEPLGYLSRAELELRFMKNIELAIQKMGKTSHLRHWWDNHPNWVRVQKFMNNNTHKAGSTSSTQQCIFMGVDPDGKSFYGDQP